MNSSTPKKFSDEITLGELIQYLVKGKYIILAFVILSLIIGIKITISAPVKYEASVSISQVQNDLNSSGFSNSNSSFGALSQVFNLPSFNRTTSLDFVIERMSSLTVAKQLDKKYGFVKTIYNSSWDETKKAWKKPSLSFKKRLYALFNIPYWAEPDANDLVNYIKKSFIVKNISGTQIKTISFKHRDPQFALYFLSTVFAETDALMRYETQKRLEGQKKFIEDKFENETKAIFKQNFLQLLLNIEHKISLINSDQPFVAEVIDGPKVSSLPVEPKPDFILLVSLVAGIALGLTTAIIFGLIKTAKKH